VISYLSSLGAKQMHEPGRLSPYGQPGFFIYHGSTEMYQGFVTRVVADRGFGFIAVANQPDYFFHAKDLAGELDFDESLKERRVEFDILDSPKGPRAVKIRAAD